MTPVARAEDAATEERLNQLSGKIEDLIASHEAQRKRVAELSREIDSLRDQHCEFGQGYYFAAALPPSEIERRLAAIPVLEAQSA